MDFFWIIVIFFGVILVLIFIFGIKDFIKIQKTWNKGICTNCGTKMVEDYSQEREYKPSEEGFQQEDVVGAIGALTGEAFKKTYKCPKCGRTIRIDPRRVL